MPTKKHFEAMAAALAPIAATVHPDDDAGKHDLFCDTVNAIAEVFKSENPRFDEDRFFDAVWASHSSRPT